MKLKLKNIDETVNILDSSTAFAIAADFFSINEVDWARVILSDEGLSDFQFVSDAGEVMGRYSNHVLERTAYVVENEVYHVTYITRKLTDTEIRLNALEKGQDLQDGAIEELAGIVGGE